MGGLRWRLGVILCVLLGAGYYIYPPDERINLGLDLQGGIHLVLEVQSEKAVESKVERYYNEVKSELKSKDIRVRKIVSKGRSLTIQIHRENDRTRFLELMKEYPDAGMSDEEWEDVYIHSKYLIRMQKRLKNRL